MGNLEGKSKEIGGWKWVPFTVFSKNYKYTSKINLIYQSVTSGSILGVSLLGIVYYLNEIF